MANSLRQAVNKVGPKLLLLFLTRFKLFIYFRERPMGSVLTPQQTNPEKEGGRKNASSLSDLYSLVQGYIQFESLLLRE